MINSEQIQALKGNLVIDPYYLVECGNCAEIYPSNKLAGGCQIADTGDYGDCYCPHCDASEEYEDLGNNAASAWNYQQKRIDSLLAERDADKALIAEQAKRIAELEARTVSVKLPEGYKPHVQKGGTQSTSYRAVMSGKGPWIHRDMLIEACAAAGITLDVGE